MLARARARARGGGGGGTQESGEGEGNEAFSRPERAILTRGIANRRRFEA